MQQQAAQVEDGLDRGVIVVHRADLPTLQAEFLELKTEAVQLATGNFGIAITGVQKDSVLSQLGFQDGDVVESVNDMLLGQKDALDIAANVRDANAATVVRWRADKSTTIKYVSE